MRRFCFTDSSGILKSDRFFGTGLLIVKNVGDLGDKLYKNGQPAKALVKGAKNRRIDALLSQGKKPLAGILPGIQQEISRRRFSGPADDDRSILILGRHAGTSGETS